MKVEIIEFDNDYNAYAGSETQEFESLEAAKKHCKNQSWSGYSYSIGWFEKDDIEKSKL